ncbi:DNA/RNA non-specific endonuclease [Companilactobacillus ginsenosidimutans]|uniref:DNA-entry nuclease n=1 Tax=Companilactobacillus ginsenosidimutans TaxID=1007676 RepID=A0A0H4QXU9_9LACO|nr:DNA/RNA non-specific endonuclease [Companilactobacillus ginsenosidimutans]AKP66300.1 DNA-entry nuclease [Companilactobacillus ginsenosidimutans]
MYMLALIVLGIIILLATFMTKPKKRQRKKLFTLGILLVVVGGSGTYESYQNKSNSDQQQATSSNVKSNSQLADLKYNGTQEVEVNNNQPTFSQQDLSVQKGAWQSFENLDNYNRAIRADALLNKSLMPTAKREPLYVNPTGWHNKKIHGGWLYNRSHLIGYQLTGQNNNPKNLMTGTRSLNAPEMLKHEDDIAYYLKQNPSNFIRYRVQPIYRGNELLARGVQMMGESMDTNGNVDKQIYFNVYIFNVEKGVNINYADGTSVVNNN